MASLLFLMSTQLLGANPVGWPKAAGMADTNVHYFNGTFLAFATHDYSPQVCDVHRPHHHCARGGGSVPFLHVYTPHRCWRLSRTYTKRTSTLHGALHMSCLFTEYRLPDEGLVGVEQWGPRRLAARIHRAAECQRALVDPIREAGVLGHGCSVCEQQILLLSQCRASVQYSTVHRQ